MSQTRNVAVSRVDSFTITRKIGRAGHYEWKETIVIIYNGQEG